MRLAIPLLLLSVTPAATVRAAAELPLGPTLAVEDTMRTEVSEVLVKAPRVTLEEILDRVAIGEARREARIQDQSYVATVRIVRDVTGRRGPELLVETVSQIYKKRPGKVRAVLLRHYEKPDPKGKDDDDDVDAEYGPGMGEDIVRFAFRPEARRTYKYRIVGRELLGDHLIYRIAFEPRSALAVYEPSGEVWVNTREFVIVRQELTFKESPVPLFLKGIRRATIERVKVGEHWVLSRALARIEATVPLPKVGRAFDFGLQYEHYVINQGLPDSLFAGEPRRRGGGSVRVGVGR